MATKIKWTRDGANYRSKCGRFLVEHTGTRGRSTRVFTARVVSTGKMLGTGGMKAAKELCQRTASEVVRVQVELSWGRKWNGSWYEPTGCGVAAIVMQSGSNAACQARGEYTFRGCPAGRVYEGYCDDQAAIKAAIADFVFRGKYEYEGNLPLSVDMIEVAEVRDTRKSED
jgi:hypothetical protein